jgi:hypothetical protein
MPEVSGEGDHVTADALMIARGMREGCVGEVEPQVMEPGTPPPVFRPSDAQGVDDPAKDPSDRIAVKLAAPDGDKNKGTGARLTKPAHEISLKPLFCAGVQGEPSALSKLGISDEKPGGRHVLDPQIERFGDP